MTGSVRTIAYGSGREIGVSVYRDMGGDRGVRIAQRDTHGGLAAIKLTPEQAGELVAALIDSGACVLRPEVPKSAADLPPWSIIAAQFSVWIKDSQVRGWPCTDGSVGADELIDEELAGGATVLRVGDGTTGARS